MSDDFSKGYKKVTVNLPIAAVDALAQLANERGTTLTEVLRTAISTEKYLDDREKQGAKILVEEQDRSQKQLVFRR